MRSRAGCDLSPSLAELVAPEPPGRGHRRSAPKSPRPKPCATGCSGRGAQFARADRAVHLGGSAACDRCRRISPPSCTSPDQLETKFNAVRRANDWLDGRVASCGPNSASRGPIAELRATSGLTRGVSAGLATEQVSRINTDLVEARNLLATAEARLMPRAARRRRGRHDRPRRLQPHRRPRRPRRCAADLERFRRHSARTTRMCARRGPGCRRSSAPWAARPAAWSRRSMPRPARPSPGGQPGGSAAHAGPAEPEPGRGNPPGGAGA